jgi:hypothetical protein
MVVSMRETLKTTQQWRDPDLKAHLSQQAGAGLEVLGGVLAVDAHLPWCDRVGVCVGSEG